MFSALNASASSAQHSKGTEDVDGDRVGRAALAPEVISGIGRGPRSDPKDAQDRGMIETGLEPKFDEKVECPVIDDGWAINYTKRRGRVAFHGGIDIPARRGTPVLAVANGIVVGKLMNENNPKGIEIILRHRPQDTGLPVWVYTQYTHLLEMPSLAIGQRIRMGQEIGKTSNTGISGAEARRRGGDAEDTKRFWGRIRRDALHFGVLYSVSPKFMQNERVFIPVDGYWMDPNALYRTSPPYDSASLKALADGQKRIPIPYILPSGETRPAGTKVIWPYPCTPK